MYHYLKEWILEKVLVRQSIQRVEASLQDQRKTQGTPVSILCFRKIENAGKDGYTDLARLLTQFHPEVGVDFLTPFPAFVVWEKGAEKAVVSFVEMNIMASGQYRVVGCHCDRYVRSAKLPLLSQIIEGPDWTAIIETLYLSNQHSESVVWI